jgi:carboxyl-terminal processing protease
VGAKIFCLTSFGNRGTVLLYYDSSTVKKQVVEVEFVRKEGRKPMKRRSFLYFIALVLSLLLNSVVLSQQPTPDLRQETFEIVWKRVKEKHYDPNLNGVDWDAVHEKYAPRVATVKTDEELYRLLSEMLGELKQSHFAIIPPSAYLNEEEGSGNSFESNVGLMVQLIEGQPTITRVEPDSSASQAGLRPGFIITHIDDKPLEELQKRIAARKERPVRERSLLMRAVLARLRGPADSTVSVRYLDEKDTPRTVTLKRQKPDGQPVKLGELPTFYARVQAKRLTQGIGYVRFNTFMVPILEEIQKAIQSFHDAHGMIIDLRGNPGGVGAMATGVARLFYKERATLGTMKMRQGEAHFVIFPAADAYTGPVAILTDEGTGSTSEVLASGMQENGRVTIVGQPSVGAVLPSVIEKLPIGARLQYAIADFKTPQGVLIEGRGVLPDVPVEITRRDLLAGRDPVLEQAVSVLLNHLSRSEAGKSKQQSQ